MFLSELVSMGNIHWFNAVFVEEMIKFKPPLCKSWLHISGFVHVAVLLLRRTSTNINCCSSCIAIYGRFYLSKWQFQSSYFFVFSAWQYVCGFFLLVSILNFGEDMSWQAFQVKGALCTTMYTTSTTICRGLLPAEESEIYAARFVGSSVPLVTNERHAHSTMLCLENYTCPTPGPGFT